MQQLDHTHNETSTPTKSLFVSDLSHKDSDTESASATDKDVDKNNCSDSEQNLSKMCYYRTNLTISSS